MQVQEMNSGVIRSTVDGPVYFYKERGLMQEGVWEQFYCVLTNIGLYKFDQNDNMQQPELFGIKMLQFETLKDQIRAQRGNLFEI